MTKPRDEVEQAIRAAIHDTYRYGIGFALEAIEQFRGQSTDPDTFDKLLDYIRQYSVTLWDGR